MLFSHAKQMRSENVDTIQGNIMLFSHFQEKHCQCTRLQAFANLDKGPDKYRQLFAIIQKKLKKVNNRAGGHLLRKVIPPRKFVWKYHASNSKGPVIYLR